MTSASLARGCASPAITADFECKFALKSSTARVLRYSIMEILISIDYTAEFEITPAPPLVCSRMQPIACSQRSLQNSHSSTRQPAMKDGNVSRLQSSKGFAQTGACLDGMATLTGHGRVCASSRLAAVKDPTVER